MITHSKKANILIVCMLVLGGSVLLQAAQNWTCANPARLVCYFIVAVLSSGMKVSLPGVNGTMSVAFLFTLIGVEELSLPETLLMIGVATLVQSTWGLKNGIRPIQVLFNVANIAIAIELCDMVYHFRLIQALGVAAPIRLVLASATYFVINTYPVAAVISFTENKRMTRTWYDCYFWSFPFYAGRRVHRRRVRQP